MTVSGTTQLNPTTNQLINRSLRMVGAYAATSSPRPEQVNDALLILNMMLKAWQTEGHLWLKQYCTLFLNVGQASYDLSSIGNHCVTGYKATQLASSAAAGMGTVNLTNPTGITNGDWIGIADNSGQIEWFYVSMTGAVGTLYSNSTLTVAATMAVTADSGNVVYSHKVSEQIDRPTRVFEAARRLSSGIEIPLTIMSRDEYKELTNKTVQAPVVQVYYDPQMVTGKLYIWPTTNLVTDRIVMTVDRPINIQTSDLNTYDLPYEWFECITYGLAERLWPEYPTSGADYNLLLTRYTQLKEAINSYDREPASSFFSMSRY